MPAGRPVDSVGGLPQAQLGLVVPLGVAEERPAGAQPGAERRRHLRRVHTHRHEPGVGDLGLILKPHQATEERLLLGTPEPSVEVQQQGIASGQVGEPTTVPAVVGQLQVRNRPPGRSSSGIRLGDDAVGDACWCGSGAPATRW